MLKRKNTPLFKGSVSRRDLGKTNLAVEFLIQTIKENPGEIILITLLVITGFIVADSLVNTIIMFGALQRFVTRIGFLAQYIALIYLIFESRDISRRVRWLEIHLSRKMNIGEK